MYVYSYLFRVHGTKFKVQTSFGTEGIVYRNLWLEGIPFKDNFIDHRGLGD